MIAVEVADVRAVRRGSRLVQIPDLELGDRGIVRVQGPNGTGKSTLVELIAGRIPSGGGRVRVCGFAAAAPAARAVRRVCRTEIGLLDHVSLRRHATLFARAAAVPADDAIEALRDEGLGERIDGTVAELSTGERRRAWVRLTTLGDAPVLLLDEPLLGVDEHASQALATRIAAWAETRLVLLVDHGPRDWDATVLHLPADAERSAR